MVLKWMLAVGESQGLALGHVGSNLLVVDVGAQLIGHQHHHHVAGLGSLFHFHHLEVGVIGGKLSGLGPVAGTLPQAHHNVDAALGQVLGVGVALAAEADDGNGLAVQHTQVAVAVVILFDRHNSISPFTFVSIQNANGSIFPSPSRGAKNLIYFLGQLWPGSGNCTARISWGGFCIRWCIPPRSMAVTPVRHCSKMV